MGGLGRMGETKHANGCEKRVKKLVKVCAFGEKMSKSV